MSYLKEVKTIFMRTCNLIMAWTLFPLTIRTGDPNMILQSTFIEITWQSFQSCLHKLTNLHCHLTCLIHRDLLRVVSLLDKELDKLLLTNKNKIMDSLLPNNKPRSILVQGRGLSWTSIRTPTDRSRNKPSEQTKGNRTADEVNKQGTRVEGCGCHGTKRIRRRFELRWNKVFFSCLWRWKFSNQSKLFHQIQNVFPGNALQKKFGKHMIQQFHAENTAFFDFLPVLCKLRDLRRKNTMNDHKTFQNSSLVGPFYTTKLLHF